MSARSHSKQDLINRLVCLNDFEKSHAIKIDLAYSDKDHPDNVFKTAFYKKQARCWCDTDLAHITLGAATLLKQTHNYSLVIKDCLRTIDAQTAMQNCDLVRANPHWLEEPNQLISTPGGGGHPRAMAVDVELFDDTTQEKRDMGTLFDYLAPDGEPNLAARNVTSFKQEILDNRHALENAFLTAATDLGLNIMPLPEEWWDFRLLPDFYNKFPALSDNDLPPEIHLYY